MSADCNNAAPSKAEQMSSDYRARLLLKSVNLEFGNAESKTSDAAEPRNFLTWLEWAPDCSSILTSSYDRNLRLWSVGNPWTILEGADKNKASSLCAAAQCDVSGEGEITLVSEANETNFNLESMWRRPLWTSSMAGAIRSIQWYPLALRHTDHNYFLFAAAAAGQTVSLYRAHDAVHHASYVPVNHVEEILSPFSLAFSHTGAALFCGFDGYAMAFDLSRPGRTEPLASTLTGCRARMRKRRDNGSKKLKGIYSWIADSCQETPGVASMLAVSTYAGDLGFLDSRTLTCFAKLRPALEHSAKKFHNAAPSAPTQVEFAQNGTYAISSHRGRDGLVTCTDVRTMQVVWAHKRRQQVRHSNQQRTSVKLALAPGTQNTSDAKICVAAAGCGPFGNQVHALDLATGAVIETCVLSEPRSTVSCCAPRGPFWATCSGHRLNSSNCNENQENFNHESVVALYYAP